MKKLLRYGFGCLIIYTVLVVWHSHGPERKMIDDVLRLLWR